MDVPVFVALAGIHLLGRQLPSALPPRVRAALADDAAGPASTARYALSVAVAGLVLLLVSAQCSSGGGGAQQRQCPAEVAMEARAVWLNCAALFLGAALVAVARPPHAYAAPIVEVAVHHLAGATETIALTAFAHDLCIFLKILKAAEH